MLHKARDHTGSPDLEIAFTPLASVNQTPDQRSDESVSAGVDIYLACFHYKLIRLRIEASLEKGRCACNNSSMPY